jgi:hypothetical protein
MKSPREAEQTKRLKQPKREESVPSRKLKQINQFSNNFIAISACLLRCSGTESSPERERETTFD